MSSRHSSSSLHIAGGLLLLLLFGAFSAKAQDTISGTIIGTVRDRKTSAPLPASRVRIVNEANGRVRTTIADARGEYRLPFLPEGSYTVTANKETYLPEVLTKFPVQFGQYNQVGTKYHKLAIDIKLSRPTLKGQVNDAHGRMLTGAEVVVIAQNATLTQATRSDAAGRYEIPDLPVGSYFIEASWNGERMRSGPFVLDREELVAPAITIPGVSEEADAVPQAQPPLSAPSGRQASEGEKVARLTRAMEAARSANFSGRQIGSLPLGGGSYMRSFDELALLVAGVAPPPYTPGARGPGVGFGVGTAGQFSVNGLRARSNNFSVDGSDNNDADVGVRRQGFVSLVPQSIESVEAFSVSTLLWDAELGRNAGGQVNVVSKSGANQWHGEGYGFFNNSNLNARNFFDYTGGAAGGKDSFTRTQAGATLGGPIGKGRAQFFASFERQIVNAATEQHFATPSAAERSLGFNNGAAFGALAFDEPQPFLRATPLGENILSRYPLANFASGPFGANTLTRILPANGDGTAASLRGTRQLGERHELNARYNIADDARTLPSVNRAINSSLDAGTRSHNLSLVLDGAWTDTRFNQARFSFGRTQLDFSERQGSPLIFGSSSSTSIQVSSLGTIPFTSQTGPIGELLIEPYSPVGADPFSFPQNRASNTFQFADTFAWTINRHLLKFGGNLRRYQLNSRMDRLYRPQVVYAGGLTQTGQAVLDAAGKLGFKPDSTDPVVISGLQQASLGVASAVLQTITSGTPDSSVGLRFNEYHVFVNDNWRVRPNFTVDYGLRYEYSSVPHSADKRIERALVLEDLPAQGTSRFNATDRTDKFNAAVDAYRQVLAGRNRIYDPDRNNFGPHLGFAWSPDKEGRMAIRGGYGIYYDAVLGAIVTQSRNVFPREIPVNVDPSFLSFDVYSLNNPANLRVVRDAQGNFTNPVDLLKAGVCNQFGTCNQFGGTPADFVALMGLLFMENSRGGGLAFTLPEKNLRTPYVQQWHLTAERQLFDDYVFSVAYVGTKGTKLTRLLTPNLGQIGTPYIPLAGTLTNQTTPYSFPVIFNSYRGQSLVGGILATRPNTNLGAYRIYENSAASLYHALQLEGRKRYDHGLQFSGAYTWSHAIDDVSDVFTLAGASILPQDRKNLRAERGSANFDLRHRVAASLIWDLPVGGWQLSSILQAQTGQPFTLDLPYDANLDGNLSDRPTTMTGLRVLEGRGPRRVALDPGRETNDFFSFNQNQAGAVGRNTLRGDGLVSVDLAVTKTFQFSDNRSFALRAEVFNLLNRANFGLPVRTIGAPGFGSAVETASPARMVQFAVKYRF